MRTSPKNIIGKCLNCDKPTARSRHKYCTNFCQQEYQRQILLDNWKLGKHTGLSNIGTVSTYIKIYLRKKYGNKCVLCGWSKINPKTKQVPLVADHIDGNWRNNAESNLRLLCPNCDSLTPTYAGANRGNGRKNRRLSKRTEEARMLIRKLVI